MYLKLKTLAFHYSFACLQLWSGQGRAVKSNFCWATGCTGQAPFCGFSPRGALRIRSLSSLEREPLEHYLKLKHRETLKVSRPNRRSTVSRRLSGQCKLCREGQAREMPGKADRGARGPLLAGAPPHPRPLPFGLLSSRVFLEVTVSRGMYHSQQFCAMLYVVLHQEETDPVLKTKTKTYLCSQGRG